MRTVLSLVAKDFRVFWSDKVAVALTFVVPMALITIFGMVFGGAGGSPGGVRLLVVDEAGSGASARIIEALEAETALRVARNRRNPETEELRPLTRADAEELLRTNASTWRFAVIFPKDFQKETFGFRLVYLYNPQSDVEHQIVTGLIQKTFFSNMFPILEESFMAEANAFFGPGGLSGFQSELARLISDTFGASYEDVMATFPEDSIFPDFSTGSGGDGSGEATGGDPLALLLDLDSEQVHGKGQNAAAQSVGGWAVMFLLFSMSGAASSLFDERARSLFHRLLAGPVDRSDILWSKFFFCGALGLLQMVVLLAFGHVLFGVIESPAQLIPLLLVSAAGTAAATAFGMLLSAVSRSQAQASGFGTLLILSMSAVGGAMFPAFMLPALIRDWIAPLTPVFWAMDGLLAILWRNEGIPGILHHVAILLGMTAPILLLALWGFRRGDLFR